MSSSSLLQYVLFLLVVTVLVKPVGGYLAHVFGGEKTLLDSILRRVERLAYKLARVDPEQEMDWKRYAISFVCSGLVGTLLSIVGSLLLTWQGVPMNFSPYTEAATLEGGAQVIAQGPVGGD